MADRPTGRPRTIDPDRVSLVALRLFDERGYDLVSMDEVAAAAGVSRRSLFRLFPTKASLVWGGLDEFAERLTAALDARPADEPARAGLRAAYRAAATFPDAVVETTRHRLRVIRANPTLAREAPRFPGGTEEHLVRFVAEHDGFRADGLAPAVTAAVVIGAATAALRWWAEQDDGRPEDAVDRALRDLS
ncbi:TetR/AcrR family transcriptional regulator [Curtobacterium sp. MCBD17_023]|uniref:TetR/AcrR family transcriptional regulator n=1 Tax=Curtobacterium sp. MCBD17_023 TaxID=2175657 RepID=UPI000D83F0F7|nr:TetR family transcriptional regulator [Curtobacterium sp. MCBD17_023]PYY49644.1 TetR family transcriptional regulator [Curtobacterium sp. MCBD17_023]